MIPLFDFPAQHKHIRTELIAAMAGVLNSGRYILGPEVERFEYRVADYLGVAHAIGMSSGTDALLASLMALDIGPGDVVLTTPYSFVATVEAIQRVGAEPAFVDIDVSTYNISLDGLSRFMSEDPRAERVKAIIPVHLFGLCADMAGIMDLCVSHGLYCVEDAAQAFGATYLSKRGRRTYAGTGGTLGCFSFFPTKPLGGVGDGGMVVTNSADYAELLRAIRSHGSEHKYYSERVGGNFRLDELQAAVLNVKLPYVDEWAGARTRNAEMYRHILGLPMQPADNGHVWAQCVVQVEDRTEVRLRLKAADIGSAVYYPMALARGYNGADYCASRALALPCGPELGPSDIMSVCEHVHSP